ncbi:MAG: DUF308 domain-containing protein [Victivallales bacterium]|nr:DUF308 domain-containing protein [Victivallales bacterium]
MSAQNDVFSKFAQHTVWDFIISRGIVALIIGILLITMPGATISMLCILIGIFLLINGLVALIKAFKPNNGKKTLLVYGLICLLAGLVILTDPGLLAGFFVIVFSLLVLISGVNQLVAGIKAKDNPAIARILAAVAGLISIALGSALLIRPDIGLAIIVMLIGIYFMAFGILAIATGLTIRKNIKNII